MPEAESSPTPAAGTELPDPRLPEPETMQVLPSRPVLRALSISRTKYTAP